MIWFDLIWFDLIWFDLIWISNLFEETTSIIQKSMTRYNMLKQEIEKENKMWYLPKSHLISYIIWYYIILNFSILDWYVLIILSNITLCYVVLYYNAWYDVILYYITWHYIILYFITLSHVILHYIISCHIILHIGALYLYYFCRNFLLIDNCFYNFYNL